MEAGRWSQVSKNTVTYWSLWFLLGVGELGRGQEDTDRKAIFIQIDSQNLVDQLREHRPKHLEI